MHFLKPSKVTFTSAMKRTEGKRYVLVLEINRSMIADCRYLYIEKITVKKYVLKQEAFHKYTSSLLISLGIQD